jgi:hypothetical protein
MGSDRRTFFNQLASVGAFSGLAAILPSDALAKVEAASNGSSTAEHAQVSTLRRTHTQLSRRC